jgi:hypothetical protein
MLVEEMLDQTDLVLVQQMNLVEELDLVVDKLIRDQMVLLVRHLLANAVV